MNTFELKVWDDESSYCTFYTVHQDGASLSETQKFLEKFNDENNPYSSHLDLIISFLYDVIGEKYGAIINLFDRHKNLANALPPKPNRGIPEVYELGVHFPLRLYCLRINDNLVILFNGGVKDKRTDQESPDISLKFHEAQTFAKRITSALNEGMIKIDSDNRTLLSFDNKREIII